MSSSDDEDDFAYYGTPLEPIEEDAVPSKRPTRIEDQEVRDQQGRRRFHGAFTGGFSAGYFNSVGSEEGWSPATFKSSRSSKANQAFQKPEDFMDEEDKSEFGIAPKVLRATADYKQSSGVKRPRVRQSEGPIPGQPVLRDILQPARETVGVRLLRQMGWRPGQGVGPRLSHHQKKKQQLQIREASKKIYGCAMPGKSTVQDDGSDGGSTEDSEDEGPSGVTFAPDDYDTFLVKPKDDVFGIGYKGLDKRPVLSGHVQLFEPSFLGMQEKKKKVAIWGQAFGVGALEEDDEDIYAKDDMSRYDFALETSASLAQRKREEREAERRGLLALTAGSQPGAPLEGFVLGKKQPVARKKYFPPPVLPPGFKAQHIPTSSQQQQLPVQVPTQVGVAQDQRRGLLRHELGPMARASMLDEPINIPRPPVPLPATPSPSGASPVAPTVAPTASPSLSASCNTSSSYFRPFASQPDKQARYEKYLEFVKTGRKELFSSIQPITMTEWDKEHELSEFEQAARIYKPLTGLMGDRFVSASQPDDALDPLVPVERTRHGNKEMQNAAKMNMFGKLTRTRSHWRPVALLCKRFNIPQPTGVPEATHQHQSSTKFSVFDFLDASKHNAHALEEKHSEPLEPLELPEPSPVVVKPATADLPNVVHIDKPNAPRKSRFSIEMNPSTSETKPSTSEKELSSPEKKTTSIGNTLARLLADETGKEQPEPEEKPDLFKAIFLTSSEESASDSDEEESEKSKRADSGKVDASDSEKSQGGIKSITNVLRNMSPPRGIFANLDLDALNTRKASETKKSLDADKVSPQNEESSSKTCDESDESLLYGPRLPSALPKVRSTKPSDNAGPTSVAYASAPVSGKWVERSPKDAKKDRHDSSSSSDSDSSYASAKKSERSLSRPKKSKKEKHKKHSKHKKDKKHKKHKSKSKHKKRKD